MMNDYELRHIDPESVELLLESAEKSFDIKFSGNELAHIETFGELCDHIANKIPLRHCDDCTPQQAFYKIRHAITSSLSEANVTPDTRLHDILPRKKRLSGIRKIEDKLGFSLKILRPKYYMSSSLAILFLISLFTFLINRELAIFGIVFSLIGLQIIAKFGKEMDIKTVGDLQKK